MNQAQVFNAANDGRIGLVVSSEIDESHRDEELPQVRVEFQPFHMPIQIDSAHESISEIEDTQSSVRQQIQAKKSKATAKPKKKNSNRRNRK